MRNEMKHIFAKYWINIGLHAPIIPQRHAIAQYYRQCPAFHTHRQCCGLSAHLNPKVNLCRSLIIDYRAHTTLSHEMTKGFALVCLFSVDLSRQLKDYEKPFRGKSQMWIDFFPTILLACSAQSLVSYRNMWTNSFTIAAAAAFPIQFNTRP